MKITHVLSDNSKSRANLQGPAPGVDVAVLALRFDSDLAFLYHGAAILFGAFGGPARNVLQWTIDFESWSAI
jgi:hypothetical protein